MFKYLLAILIIIMPALVFANVGTFDPVKNNSLSGTWFIYGVALYQPLERTVVDSTNRQTVYKTGFNYGVGIGKDHLRMEVSRYMEKFRFLAAFDLFPNYIGSPYFGFVYGRGLHSKAKNALLKEKVTRNDAVVGITFQPINYFSVYAEYVLRDSFFFGGLRVRLPYTFK